MTNNSSVIPVPEECVSKDSFQYLPWDNEDNLVPKHVDNMISLVLSGICVPLLFCVSFSTNIINMIVFWKHGLQERINACLFTLSLVDLISISVVFGISCDRLYMFIIGKEDEVGPATQFIHRYYLVGLLGLTTSSQMVYSVIAVERCLCVTKPLLVKRFMSTRTTMILLWSMVFAITGTATFVLGVQYGVVCIFDPQDRTLFHKLYPRDVYFRMKSVIDLIHSTLMGFGFSGLILTCVVISTIVTAVKLRQLSQWRKSVSSASESVSSRDVAIARVIIGTSILFTVCMVPTLLKYTSLIIAPEIGLGGRHDNLGWIFKRFYEFGTSINNTFNFFVYYVFGTKFRETVFLRPEIFSLPLPDSLNYGSLGSIVGHEISHSLDAMGRRFDQHGNFRRWWLQQDVRRYKERTQCFRHQFDQFTFKQGNVSVNGNVTLSENMADTMGLNSAFQAFNRLQRSQKRFRLPGLSQLSADQLFFLAFAQTWCSRDSTPSLFCRLRTDTHSPNQVRVLGSVMNCPRFASAFRCQPGLPMNPANRCLIWK